MNQSDMKEAIRMIAADRGISVDALLQVLVEALATAYKKRDRKSTRLNSSHRT